MPSRLETDHFLGPATLTFHVEDATVDFFKIALFAGHRNSERSIALLAAKQ